jgi:hypothetical protein
MIRAPALLAYRERTAYNRLGFGEAVRVLKQKREIVEADRDIGMIRAIPPLADCQRPAVQLLSFGVVRLRVEETADFVEQPSRRLRDPSYVRLACDRDRGRQTLDTARKSADHC